MGVEHAASRLPRLNFELTTACDHRCLHCYNVWNADTPSGAYQRGQLSTADTRRMLEQAVRDSGADFVVLTGGEPLLRPDAMELVRLVCTLCPTVSVVTNGSHVDTSRARELADAGVRGVQLTLLSADPQRHNALKGIDCFADTVRAAQDLRNSGVHVQVCFVATHDNWQELPGVIELCAQLDVRDLVYNRMAPSGGAVQEATRLVPSVEELEHNLAVMEQGGRLHNMRVSTAMPIMPCLVRAERYPWIRFGFCSTVSGSPNVVIDPLGNVRGCNLAAEVLGNVLEQSWDQILAAPYWRAFGQRLPELCRGCAFAASCRGGCQESARAVFGDGSHIEPLLHLALHPEQRAPQQAPAADDSAAATSSELR